MHASWTRIAAQHSEALEVPISLLLNHSSSVLAYSGPFGPGEQWHVRIFFSSVDVVWTDLLSVGGQRRDERDSGRSPVSIWGYGDSLH